MTQILHAGSTATDIFVAFDVRWDDDLSGNDSVLWSMIITSPDGRETVQLGYKVVDGTFAAQFVNDWNTASQQNVDQDADFRETEITVRFPASSVGVAAEWPTWRAVLNVNGRDVAEHPAAPT